MGNYAFREIRIILLNALQYQRLDIQSACWFVYVHQLHMVLLNLYDGTLMVEGTPGS
jgi:hypothetical protein